MQLNYKWEKRDAIYLLAALLPLLSGIIVTLLYGLFDPSTDISLSLAVAFLMLPFYFLLYFPAMLALWLLRSQKNEIIDKLVLIFAVLELISIIPIAGSFAFLGLFPTIIGLFTFSFPLLVIGYFAIMRFRKGDKSWRKLALAVLIYTLITVLLLYLSDIHGYPPETCMMPAGINCQKTYLSTDGTMAVTLVNGLQKNIVVTGMACTQESDPTDFEAQDISASMGQAFSPENPLTCYDLNGDSIVEGGALANGYEYSGKIYLKYYFVDEGSANIRTIVGTVTVKAQTPY